jgi:acyl-CoA synthetase (AMP-forming)/AMP-acid ligase II
MILNRIYEWARSEPTKTAVISHDRQLSYCDFARAIAAARSFLERHDLPIGQTAIVLQNTSLDAWVLVMALRSLGLDTICIPSIDRAEALKLRNVSCVVMSEAKLGAPKFAGPSLHGVKAIVVPSAIFSDIRAGDPPSYPHQAPPFGGHMLLTSGTTGTYKKVFLDGADEDRRNSTRAQAYPLTKDMIYHIANFGLWTALGFRMPSAVWHAGGCVVMDNRRNPLGDFFRCAVDLSVLTPSMLKELVQSLGPGPTHDSCELLIASGFLAMDLADETVRRVTKRIGVSYSSTELGTAPLLSRGDGDGDIQWLTPAPNRAIRIVDDNGDNCPPGQEGELRIGLIDIDCTSYVDDDEASVKVFRDGFFCPGDIAVSRADGRVRVLGRALDVLHFREKKVAAAPIELAVQHALGVDEVCLFSGLNKAGIEELVVVIQTDQVVPKSALEQIARRFPSFQSIRFEPFKEFPRTEAGTKKTQRSALRKLVFPERSTGN